MSKLIDKLNQVARVEPQPMGFRTPQPKAKPKVLLIASLVQDDYVNNLADYLSGADAVLLPAAKSSQQAGKFQEIARSLSGIPWGCWLGDTGKKSTKSLMASGCDFVVLSASATLATPQEDKVGKVLQVESSISEGLLRAANELPIDAVLITDMEGEEDFLTWRHLMLFQRFADLLTKPLLASIPSNVTADELQLLFPTGVDGVVVEVGVGHPAGKLGELRRMIDKLTFPSPHKQRKVEALLPHISEKTSPVTEEEEEEEEEE